MNRIRKGQLHGVPYSDSLGIMNSSTAMRYLQLTHEKMQELLDER
jgi:hypothetical protein